MRLDGESFTVAAWQDAGETSRERPIAPLHVHHGDDEAWVVLEGRLGFRVGDEEVEAGPGEGVLVPRGTPHTFWNAASPRATRYLIVMTPRIARLVDALHEPDADPRELFRRHDSELV